MFLLKVFGRFFQQERILKSPRWCLVFPMRDKLKIPEEDIEQIRFERVHRIPTKKNTSQGQNSKPRPIIAKFSFFQDKEYVWSFVRNLKNTNISIANDFPREIDEIQKTLYPILKKAKQRKQTAYFEVDKLIINRKSTEVKKQPISHTTVSLWTQETAETKAKAVTARQHIYS